MAGLTSGDMGGCCCSSPTTTTCSGCPSNPINNTLTVSDTYYGTSGFPAATYVANLDTVVTGAASIFLGHNSCTTAGSFSVLAGWYSIGTSTAPGGITAGKNIAFLMFCAPTAGGSKVGAAILYESSAGIWCGLVQANTTNFGNSSAVISQSCSPFLFEFNYTVIAGTQITTWMP